MRVEETNDGVCLFLNNFYFKDVNWDSKHTIETAVRDIIFKLKKYFGVHLKGFYKIKIYPSDVGVFMEIIRLDEDNYDGSDVEFRIMVIFNKELYFKTDDFSCIECDRVLFYDGYYYINLQDIDSFSSVADMGEVVFSDVIDFSKGIYINKKDYF